MLAFLLKVMLYQRPLPVAPQPSAAAALMAMIGQQPALVNGGGGPGPPAAAIQGPSGGSSNGNPLQSGPPPGLSLSDVAAVVGKQLPTGAPLLTGARPLV